MANKEVNLENTLVCKAAEGLVFMKHDDIICLKANRNYTEIFLVEKEKPIRAVANISVNGNYKCRVFGK